MRGIWRFLSLVILVNVWSSYNVLQTEFALIVRKRSRTFCSIILRILHTMMRAASLHLEVARWALLATVDVVVTVCHTTCMLRYFILRAARTSDLSFFFLPSSSFRHRLLGTKNRTQAFLLLFLLRGYRNEAPPRIKLLLTRENRGASPFTGWLRDTTK